MIWGCVATAFWWRLSFSRPGWWKHFGPARFSHHIRSDAVETGRDLDCRSFHPPPLEPPPVPSVTVWSLQLVLIIHNTHTHTRMPNVQARETQAWIWVSVYFSDSLISQACRFHSPQGFSVKVWGINSFTVKSLEGSENRQTEVCGVNQYRSLFLCVPLPQDKQETWNQDFLHQYIFLPLSCPDSLVSRAC